VNGKREGKTDIIYADGVHGFGQFHNDKEEGKWVMKDTASGKIIDSIFYQNGKSVKFPKE
jgi:antitoxin component YwqK of YwqJK toxin-antitoxin module